MGKSDLIILDEAAIESETVTYKAAMSIFDCKDLTVVGVKKLETAMMDRKTTTAVYVSIYILAGMEHYVIDRYFPCKNLPNF